jgi:hypothetical protein
MGDRSNIYFRKGGIGVYSHNGGTRMAEAAMRVLENPAFQRRVGDPSYATRIGVQTVLESLGSRATDETGVGLWDSHRGPDDNEHRFIIINVMNGRLYVSDDWHDNSLHEGGAELMAESIQKPTLEAILAEMRRKK